MLILDNAITSGVLLNVFFAVLLAAFSLGNAAPPMAEVAKGMSAAYSIYEQIEHESAVDPLSEEGLKPASCQGRIEFKNVSFAYPSRYGTKTRWIERLVTR